MNKIVLIDDEEDDQLMFKEVIESINPTLHCETATIGKIALDKLRVSASLPAIIFLDFNMPVMNGWEFLEQYKHLRAQKAKVLIVILTTSASPDHIKRAKEIQDVTGFETKPLTKEMLTEILQ